MPCYDVVILVEFRVHSKMCSESFNFSLLLFLHTLFKYGSILKADSACTITLVRFAHILFPLAHTITSKACTKLHFLKADGAISIALKKPHLTRSARFTRIRRACKFHVNVFRKVVQMFGHAASFAQIKLPTIQQPLC
jgi:hypothetical protein